MIKIELTQEVACWIATILSQVKLSGNQSDLTKQLELNGSAIKTLEAALKSQVDNADKR